MKHQRHRLCDNSHRGQTVKPLQLSNVNIMHSVLSYLEHSFIEV